MFIKKQNVVGTSNMQVISKVAGMLWRKASPEEKGVYEN